ncbi:DUF3054 domain-containing protein [Actinomadura alba]|uniref:DUF3054 domain-containing protein n=1 Tax=Actinomadura alba TaxID=406431 RepID=A0ABR7LWS3_9ACTN|nr:DUF3054 domain-containing protein [Actinomadura alba]MBC6468957.1 DUF3054 domain-containing protein [Actinomadura alba]
MRVMVAAALDLCCVIVFVVIGRSSHDEAGSLAGAATTAWPFLVGMAAGWAASRAWRNPAGLVPVGVAVWLATVALGMVLRAVSGQGTALAFAVVSLIFLGVTMLGWRAVARHLRLFGRTLGTRSTSAR